MGMAPAEVDDCSLWQFQAAADGFRRAHQSEEERAMEMSDDEADAIAARLGIA